ncbi:permease [Tatumella morbirosei]|uniref:Permease n=1 Tax=Tatumella morbirosei TaxID=642227 RepID=A0A095T678_9GAMM|nr:MFS transporter [Tatumella morbirosei]KGD72162.1 permease [Tatumella morbirosei]
MQTSMLTATGGFTLLAVASLTIMVGCILVPGLPEIAAALGIPHAAGWLITLPSLGVVLGGPLAGKVIDRWGARTALQSGLFIYGLSGIAGMLCYGLPAVIIDRLILGGATAVVMSSGTALLALFYHGQARLSMIARQGMAIEFGGVIFLFISGLLAVQNWRWPFFLYLLSWIMLAMVRSLIPVTVEVASSELTGKSAPGSATPSLSGVLFAALMSMICFFTAVIVIPKQFYQAGIGSSDTGYFLSMVSLVAVAAAAMMPAVVKKISEPATLWLAFLCYAAAFALFALAANLSELILAGVLLGSGFGFSVPLVNHMTVSRSDQGNRGRRLASLSMALFSGQFLASFMTMLPGDSSLIFAVTSVFSVVVAVFLVLIKKTLV